MWLKHWPKITALIHLKNKDLSHKPALLQNKTLHLKHITFFLLTSYKELCSEWSNFLLILPNLENPRIKEASKTTLVKPTCVCWSEILLLKSKTTKWFYWECTEPNRSEPNLLIFGSPWIGPQIFFFFLNSSFPTCWNYKSSCTLAIKTIFHFYSDHLKKWGPSNLE